MIKTLHETLALVTVLQTRLSGAKETKDLNEGEWEAVRSAAQAVATFAKRERDKAIDASPDIL